MFDLSAIDLFGNELLSEWWPCGVKLHM